MGGGWRGSEMHVQGSLHFQTGLLVEMWTLKATLVTEETGALERVSLNSENTERMLVDMWTRRAALVRSQMESRNVLLDWRKGLPCCEVAKNLAELCSNILWQVELASDGTHLRRCLSKVLKAWHWLPRTT